MNIITDIGLSKDVQVNIFRKTFLVWSNGRFKTRKVINNPDLMRRIFFLPRLILFLLRGPLIFLKLLFIAFRKSVTKPFCKLNKKLYR